MTVYWISSLTFGQAYLILYSWLCIQLIPTIIYIYIHHINWARFSWWSPFYILILFFLIVIFDRVLWPFSLDLCLYPHHPRKKSTTDQATQMVISWMVPPQWSTAGSAGIHGWHEILPWNTTIPSIASCVFIKSLCLMVFDGSNTSFKNLFYGYHQLWVMVVWLHIYICIYVNVH